jgi:EmrB/QacA subfamily drug resistance transporter
MLSVLCVGVLVVNVDGTILNVALPTLVKELDATYSQLQWIVDIYAMVFAGLLLVGGSLADRFGRKRLFLLGFTTFGVGSFGAAFAGSVGALLAWRGLMGAGAALTIPAGLSILDNVFRDPGERARAIGIWGGSMGVGLAIGPLAGGLLLARFWWGSVFFVNVPVLLLGGVAALRLLPESRNREAAPPDPVGSLLSILGLGLLLWAIISAPTRGWTSPAVVAVGVSSLAVLGLFVAWEARSTHPMLNLRFFRSRRFSAAVAAVALGLFALFGAVFILTQFLQFDLGFTPLQAGVRILPTAALVAATAPLSTLIVRRIGSKLTAFGALVAIAGGLWQISAASTGGATYGEVLPGMLLLGLGAGLLMPTAADSVLGAVPRRDAGIGSATYVVAIQVGGALGVAVIGSMLNTRYRGRLTDVLTSHHVPSDVLHTITGSLGAALGVAGVVGGSTGERLADVARSAFMSGTHVALAAGALVAAVAALITLVALPSRPTNE